MGYEQFRMCDFLTGGKISCKVVAGVRTGDSGSMAVAFAVTLVGIEEVARREVEVESEFI